ncbi:MAG: 50S ribosomal protein L18 [Nitrospina sp.]|jgi:large subunit ribosomal protein L18|nr:50S ribosomal protein L18 [Nitrospina sp.]|tara:strand:- start:5169 stop:5534 length:366 start_codon:yes stop_codon:yes gene_type:complete
MKTSERERLRLQRKRRIRLKLQKQLSRHRLTVFRSSKHIYAQIVDDGIGKTLVAMSTLSAVFKKQMKEGGNLKAAALVGSLVGEAAAEKGIKEVYYDRNGFLYTGRIKALADAVREKGIKF